MEFFQFFLVIYNKGSTAKTQAISDIAVLFDRMRMYRTTWIDVMASQQRNLPAARNIEAGATEIQCTYHRIMGECLDCIIKIHAKQGPLQRAILRFHGLAV